MSDEIILSCPGGKCPIKISCVTHLRKDATAAMPVPPFSQHGIVITCTYFKIREYEQRLPEQTIPNQVEQKKEAEQKNTVAITEEARPVQAVATDQGQLFS